MKIQKSRRYVIVADEAFGMTENLMRPYGGKMLSYEKKIFNYRLTLARRYVECTFGIMCIVSGEYYIDR